MRSTEQQPVPCGLPSLIRNQRFSSRPDAKRRNSSLAPDGSSSPNFEYADTPRFSEAAAIAAFARDLFLKQEVDQVQVVATRFVNTLTQDPIGLEYLPVGEIKG